MTAKAKRLTCKGDKPKPKENTIEWWLAKFPPDIAKLALANRKKANGEWANITTSATLKDALDDAFEWVVTEQGEEFWIAVKYGKYAEARALLPKPAKKAKAKIKSFRAAVFGSRWYAWHLNVNGCKVESAKTYTTKKSAIRGLRRFAATLGIAVEIEVQE